MCRRDGRGDDCACGYVRCRSTNEDVERLRRFVQEILKSHRTSSALTGTAAEIKADSCPEPRFLPVPSEMPVDERHHCVLASYQSTPEELDVPTSYG